MSPPTDETFSTASTAVPVNLEDIRIAAATLDLVPREIAIRHGVLPLARHGRRLTVAIADPLDTDALDTLAYLTQLEIEPVEAAADELSRTIERAYADLAVNGEADARDQRAEPEKADEAEANAPVAAMVRGLIVEAVRRRASDIHLEPLERRFRVRYRVDGALIEAESPPKRLQLAIISRLKVMADISIAEKRVPQDGRIQIVVDGRALDLRVSSLPTAHGESIVMRILDPTGLQLGLGELGFDARDREAFERLIASPDGTVLVTGPTGSGKTTTLYSCLHHLNQTDRKIITVEDPIEYQLAGINQVPVRHEIGMTFSSALRAMLRQAPNVIMVGEIRDFETAEIATHAALTGHLVFSTLHTNDAAGAVTRLVDLGIKPFLISAALRATMAQRLVRKLCVKCAAPHAPSVRELTALGLDAAQLKGARFMRPVGCPACAGTGYYGRVGIFEIFPTTEAIRPLIHERASAARLRAAARAGGMRTMREDGARKAIAGLTSIEEVVSITVGDTA